MTEGADLTERVRRRLKALHQAKRLNLTVAAERLHMDPSAVSKNLALPDRALSLRFVEMLAELAAVPVAELMVPPDSVLKQLNPDEAFILRALRAWPASVTQSLVEFVRFFADEAPAEQQTRSLHELWRQAARQAGARNRIYALAQLEVERALSPDTLTALEHQLTSEATRRARPTTMKRRTTP